MSAASAILRNDEGGGLMFWCPGCDSVHMVRVGDGPGPRWGYNVDPVSNSFTSWCHVCYEGLDAGRNGAPPAICNSFGTNCRIQFLGDCSHALVSYSYVLSGIK